MSDETKREMSPQERAMMEATAVAPARTSRDVRARVNGHIVVTAADLRRALADVRENIGPQSQAAFAIEAIIKACEG